MKSVLWYSSSISNEREFDRVADALIIQHPRFHLRESQRRRVKAKTASNVETIQTLVGFAEKSKGKLTASGKSGARAYYANFTSVKDYDYDDDMNEPADANKPTTIQLTLDGEEALDDDDDSGNHVFFVCCSG